MRKLTFKTFLQKYLMDVSGQNTVSIHKLAKISKKNIRIISPLILYCLFTNKLDLFFKYFNKDEYKDFESLSLNNYLDDKYDHYDFKKIYQSYIRKAKSFEYDNEIKSLIRNNIINLMEEKNISKYRIYTDLDLNHGNINDFLTNNNAKKYLLPLSRKSIVTAYLIVSSI